MKLMPKIIIIFLITLICSLSIFSYLAIKNEKKSISLILSKEGTLIVKIISSVSSTHIYEKDYAELNAFILTVLENYDNLLYIKISKDGKIISEINREQLDDETIVNLDKNDLLIFKDIIEVPSEYLADIEIALSLKEYHLIIDKNIKEYILLMIIFTILLLIMLVYIVKLFFLVHINKIKEHMKLIGSGNYTEVLNINTSDEFYDLSASINTMSKKINESYINLKQLTLIQAKQKKDLEDANQYKNDFLANMSHELKTPLNSINVISSIMMKNKNNSLDSVQVKNLHIINACGNDLLYLINDVLDISKLEAGEVKLDYRQINLKKLMFEIKDMFEPQVLHKNLNFIYEYDNSIGDIYSDENRIKQIIKNLLSNALKFVTKGDISFIIRDKKDDIEILVKDNGIGIASDKLEHIFDRFKQADGSTTRKYGGTGLGLAICKELSLLLKGNISVISTIDVGTEFVLILPKNKEKVKIVGDNTEVQKNKEVSKSALVLNNDPISFLSIVVELKNSYIVDQTSQVLDFLKKYNEAKYSLVIIDISDIHIEILEKLVKILNKDFYIVYKDEIPNIIKEKARESFKKPIDKKLFFSKINIY